MSINKKLASAALAATTILWAVGAAALPLANAQTTTSANLQALIASLQQQITQLTAQLNTKTTGTATATTGSSYNFGTTDLTIGSRGAGVTVLQQFLIDQGDLTAVSAPTGYFGTLTQKALAKFQTSNGIKPASGYYGPITRAFLAKYAASSSTSTSTGTSTGTTSGTGTNTTTGTTAPATGLQVGLATQPTNTSLISSAPGTSGSGAARVPVLAFTLTAGNSGAATVSQIQFQKNGVLSDSSISGAYLLQNGQVVAQYNSLSSGVLTFSGLNLSIPAGQTAQYSLAIDVAGGLNSGNTVSFSIPSSSSVTAFGPSNSAIGVAGTFPMNSETFMITTVTNPSLATVKIVDNNSISNSVTAGSQNNLVYASNFQVQNSKVYLQGLNFHVIGSANMSNIQNIKLLVNGQQVGQTLPTITNGQAYFSIPSNSAVLNTGNNNVQVFADVMGSPSYNFQFEVLNGYDVLAVDSQYGVPVSSNSDAGNQVTIQQGQITVSQDANTPSGSSLSKGMSGAVLAKFDIYAAGEPVKVQYLPFSITLTGTATTTPNFANELQNIQIVDDAGGQVGSTINLPGGTSTGDVNGSIGTQNGSVYTYTSSFGSATSLINYTIPANTTRVLTLKADIQNTADFTAIQAALVQPLGNNLQGMISSKLTQSNGASGNTLTLVPSSLSVTQDSSLGNQTVAQNSTNQEIGSYAFTASQAEGISISNLSILTGAIGTGSLANLKVYVNGAQFGTTQPTVSANTTYSFSGAPFTVPVGQTVLVKVYADILSNATLSGVTATTLSSVSGQGATSLSPVSLVSSVPGQTLSANVGGSSLTVSINSANQPTNGQLAMGTSGNTLASFNFNETSNLEDVKLTTINVLDVTTSSAPSFSGLQLWNGANLLGTVQSYTAVATTTAGGKAYVYSFTSLNNSQGYAYVPKNSTVNFTLKGNVNSLSNGAVDNSIHTFEIATSSYAATYNLDIVGQGATSGKAANVTLNSVSGATSQTILQNALTVTYAGQGSQTNPAKSASAVLASLTFTPQNSNGAALNTVNVTFAGNAVNTTSSFPTSSTYLALGSMVNGQLQVSTKYGAATRTVSGSNVVDSWNFGNATSGLNISSPLTLYLVADTTQTNIGNTNAPVSLYPEIVSTSDIQYTDGTSGSATTNIGLPASTLTPISLNNISWTNQ